MRGVLCATFVALVSACARLGAGVHGGGSDGGTGGSADALDHPETDARGTGGTGGAGDCRRCSVDLHDVVDCNDQLVSTCPSDMGCADGACVPPCDAAKANNSAYGCEFYSVTPPKLNEPQCFAALLSNTWSSPVTIKVSYGGTPLDVAGMARTPKGSGQDLSYEPLVGDQLAPGQVAILFLSDFYEGYSCPPGVQTGLAFDSSVTATGSSWVFRITTDAPIVAYDIYPYGGAKSFLSSATLLIPTSAWGKNYMAVDGYPADPTPVDNRSPTGYYTDPFVQIVAAEDATKVTISPKVAIKGGGGIAATPASQPRTYTLGKGEVLQFAQTEELAGSPIASNKPIGVWGGSVCMRIPAGAPACDEAHQQILPITWLGSEYVAVRYRDRLQNHPESVPWTLVGTVDDTVLTYDPGPPPGAPASIGRGEVVRFSASDPFVVRSNDTAHPFYVAGHMTGASFIGVGMEGSPDGGDPEFVNTVPPRQWLSSYVFLTDATYKNTHLVFIRQKGADGSFKDVTLDCAGTVTGWGPVGAAKQFEFARVDFSKRTGGCLDGAHSAHSAAPFGLTVWGWDNWVSYAYPAGLSTKPINSVVVIP